MNDAQIISKFQHIYRVLTCLQEEINECCANNSNNNPCNSQVDSLIVTNPNSNGSATASWNLVNGLDSQYKIDNGAYTSASSPLDLTGLTSGTHTIYVRGLCSEFVAGQVSQYTFTIPAGQTYAYSGFKNDKTVLSPSSIETGTLINFISGQTIEADYRSNATPKYLWMAEPTAEPTKNFWYASPDNYGEIGTSNDLFGLPIVSGNYRFYISNYKTLNQQTKFQFKVIDDTTPDPDPTPDPTDGSSDVIVVPEGHTSVLIPANTLVEYFWVIEPSAITFSVYDEDSLWISPIDLGEGGDVVESMRAFLTARTIHFSGVLSTTSIIIKTIKK